MEMPISYRDVTTISVTLSDIRVEVVTIRRLLEEEDGEEEIDEADA